MMTREHPDLASASDWLKQNFHAIWPIESTTQIWVVTRHQYGISPLVSQTSFRRETCGGVVRKCQLFSQVILVEPGSHFRNLHSAMTYLNHKTDVAFRPSKLGRVFDFKQHYEVQVMPHIVFGINVFIKGHRFVVKCWAIKTWNAKSQSDYNSSLKKRI